MTADDYADLARLAEAIHPEGRDWHVDHYGDGWQVNGAGTVFADAHALRADAEFIAAANPATILRLIEENRNLRTTVDADLEYQRRLEARLAAVEALTLRRDGNVRLPGAVIRVGDLRAVLSAAPTDTTKEQ